MLHYLEGSSAAVPSVGSIFVLRPEPSSLGHGGLALRRVDLALQGLAGDADLHVVVDLQPGDVAVDSVTKPYMPDVVMTSSPTSIDDCSAAWRFILRRCGRIIRKYIAAPMRIIGTNRPSGFERPELSVGSEHRQDVHVGIQFLAIGGRETANNRRGMLATTDGALGVSPPNSENLARSDSNVPAAIAARILAISCSVQLMLCRLTSLDAVGSPTWNRWRM